VLKKLEDSVEENKEDALILLPIIVDAVNEDKYRFVTFNVDAKMVDVFIRTVVILEPCKEDMTIELPMIDDTCNEEANAVLPKKVDTNIVEKLSRSV
jgi:hypothetical protein